jgi:hypothetical protein
MDIRRVTAVLACGLGLAACSSLSSSFDVFSSKPSTTSLAIESDPPGAEARTSLGGTCHTPCTLPITTSGDFTVSYNLTGYMPESVPVHAAKNDGGFFSSATTQLDPNPVFAELQPAAPPAKPAPPKRKKRPALPPATPAAAPAAAAPPPPPVSGFVSPSTLAPPPGTFTPAPTR